MMSHDDHLALALTWKAFEALTPTSGREPMAAFTCHVIIGVP